MGRLSRHDPGFEPTDGTTDAHILFDFGTAMPLNEIMVIPYSGSAGYYMPASLELSYSDDNVNFTMEHTWTYTGHTGDMYTQIPKIGQAEAEWTDTSGHISAGNEIDCAVFQRNPQGKWNTQGVV